MSDGLIIMRAQPFHFGHARLIDAALEVCDKVCVVLGSTQEHGTDKNPFTFGERKKMINRYYKDNGWDRILIFGLADINSHRWPIYVLDTIKGLHPELNITKIFGGSQYDVDWFKEQNLEPYILDRSQKDYPFVSATMVRDMLKYRDQKWMRCVPQCNWSKVAAKFNCTDMLNMNNVSLPNSPIVTVDAIVVREGKYLLIKRKYPPYGWAFAGGKVDAYESLEDAVLRELKEETSLIGRDPFFINVYSDPERDPRFHAISCVYMIDNIEGDAKAADDATELGWFSFSEIQQMDLAFDHKEILKECLYLTSWGESKKLMLQNL